MILPNGSRLYRPLFYDALRVCDDNELWQERSRLDWLSKAYADGYDRITGVNMKSAVMARLFQVEKEIARRRSVTPS